MSSLLRQMLVMIRANLSSLPRRRAISLSMMLSVTLVVCVLAGFLAMASGFETALAGAGSPSVAVILGGGSHQESGSDLPADVILAISATSGDIGFARHPDGTAIASRELVVAVDVPGTSGGGLQTLALRGMDADGLPIRDAITLSQGRAFRPGTRDVLVGDRLADDLGLRVGDTIRLGAADWTVSGRFSAHGSAFESEIWADLDSVRAAFNRQGQVQSLRLRLTDPASLAVLQHKLATLTGAPLVAISEAGLYAGQSERTARLIRLFGWPVALLMALGATAGALNTMMSSVADRTVEIATVRALGFSRVSAFTGTWVEAVLLASLGVLLGLVASLLLFNGWQASTIGANNARMTFELAVSGEVLWKAGTLGLAIGIIGGALPAFAATRLPLMAALRARG